MYSESLRKLELSAGYLHLLGSGLIMVTKDFKKLVSIGSISLLLQIVGIDIPLVDLDFLGGFFLQLLYVTVLKLASKVESELVDTDFVPQD